jgi:putative transposase
VLGGEELSSEEDPLRRDRWARLRYAIIGPLLAAPPAPGDLQAALSELAARPWRHPLTGLEVRFGASTIQRWYSAEKIIRRSKTRTEGIARTTSAFHSAEY